MFRRPLALVRKSEISGGKGIFDLGENRIHDIQVSSEARRDQVVGDYIMIVIAPMRMHVNDTNGCWH